MSRPSISYPTPIPSSSSSFPSQPSFPSTSTVSSRPSLEPSPMPSGASGSGRRAPSSGSSRQVSASSSRTPGGSLDSHITRLLVTTKQMLQGLESWSQSNLDEEGVSDIYVRLGNGFEVCVAAFQRAGISTSELDSIPSDLRLCLEQCLSEDPSQETLNMYLPNIRTIIYNLLNGLKQKQAAYKRSMTERQTGMMETPPPPRLPPGELAGDPRLSDRSGTSTVSQGSYSPKSTTSQLPPVKIPSSQALAERSRTGLPARPAPPDAFKPVRRVHEGPKRSPSPRPPSEQFPLIRHQLSDNPVPSPPSRQNQLSPPSRQSPLSPPPVPAALSPPTPPPKATPPRPDRFSRDSFGNPRAVSRFSMDSEITNGSPVVSQSPPAKTLIPLAEVTEPSSSPSPVVKPEPFLPTLPTINLPSMSIQFPDAPEVEAGLIESLPDVPPETRATLAALGRPDALERRASKRFSSYTFNRMLPGSSPSHSKSASVGSPQRPTRRNDRPPPMPSLPESLAGNNLGVSTNESGRAKTPSPTTTSLQLPPNGFELADGRSSSSASFHTTQSDASSGEGGEGSVRVVKTPEQVDIGTQATPRPGDIASPEQRSMPSSMPVFLQIGRQVKKVVLDLPITMSSLRLLFMERFEYDPGMEDFPDVYMRDNKTGIQFELEDMEDLRERCVLSLNIEPLDQVKQHFDLTFATMMQEFKEMKTALDHSRRMSMTTPATALLAVSPSSPHARLPPIKIPEAIPGPASPLPRSAGGVHTGPQREEELRLQHDQVQSLRRDLAVMRQIHLDFLTETKDAFTTLRKENAGMRDLVKTKMGGSRALLDISKAKLETLCADTIQAVEEISDIIDGAREDAFRRFVTPSTKHMESIKADLKRASEMVDAFAKEVTTVEPTWRATWHFELSRVMDEQRLLPHQSKLTVDLKNDIQDAEAMLQNVQDFVNQRAAGVGRSTSKGFRPPSPDESGGIPNLLMEIRTKEGDPNQRLRAIEAQQKAREREKASTKDDEFSSELSGFVQGRKLKKTGGTDEVDRQRQRKQDQTLKKMLTGDGDNAPAVRATSGSPPMGGVLSPQMTGMSLGSVSGVLSPTTSIGTGGEGTPGRVSRGSTRDSVEVKDDV